MSPQQVIAHYRIASKLGEGGMGEVWRARDTKLNRDVAIKVLPAGLRNDADRMARFTREAQVLASLNHPNIATIHGVEEGALVMELVPGPTLAERISQGALPLEEAFPIAKQIAEALEYAHEHGVIHRDLKPANVKVSPDGRVKVLDFGLAKAMTREGVSADPDDLATFSMRPTMAGVIMGTPSYMSPEQAKGKPVDRRTDIWAFGVILVEMLTGRSLYTGETMSETLAAVMMTDPDVSSLPALPSRVRVLIRRCLTKDPLRRLRDIGEARIALEPSEPELGESAVALPVIEPRRRVLPWIVAGALMGVAAISLAAVHFSEKPSELPVLRFHISPPEKTVFSRIGSATGFPGVSPDGRHIVFSATTPDGKSHLWLRTLDNPTSRLLQGTDGVFTSFWSADSRSVGFDVGGKLKKVDIAGGPPLTLTDSPSLREGSWNKEGTIVFAPNANSVLMRVPSTGGAPTPTTRFDASRGEAGHRSPWFLPDGRHFLFFASDTGNDHAAVRIGSLDSLESRLLMNSESNAIYSEGYLLFLRDGTLMARPFDVKRLELTGAAVPIAESVQQIGGHGLFSAAEAGFLAYQAGVQGGTSLTWFERSGKRLGAAGNPAAFAKMQLSPDQKSAAISVTESKNQDIWIYDLVRGLRTRFTFDPGVDDEPVWSPDGRAIVFSSNRSGHFSLYRKAADGSGTDELLLSGSGDLHPTSWSPDGRFLLYFEATPKAGNDISVLPLAAGAKPFPFVKTPFIEHNAQFSPDGRWVAYQSTESGLVEIYIAAFHPDGSAPGGRLQVSTAGGILPRWRHDGKELFFVAPDRKLMAAEIRTKEGKIEVGQVTALFGPLITGQGFLYDVDADGRRVLAVVASEESVNAEPLTIVQNWTAALKK